MTVSLCQSCGMPLDKDPKKGGTNADKSHSTTYCSYCYQDGKFTDEGISLEVKIAKNIHLAVTQLHLPEAKAKAKAEGLIPTLARWRK